MHIVVDQRGYLLLVVVLFKLFGNSLTLKLADVGLGPLDAITNDAHEAKVVVAAPFLRPFVLI